MPGLVKIGCTERTPNERARELSSTEVPGKFAVAFSLPVSDHQAAEKAVHANLAEFREVKRREFFRVDLDVAIAALRHVATLFPTEMVATSVGAGDLRRPRTDDTATRSAQRVIVAGIVESDGKVPLAGVRWSLATHGNVAEPSTPVEASLTHDRDDAHVFELECQIIEAKRMAETAEEHWRKLDKAWLSGRQKEAALEATCRCDAHLADLLALRQEYRSGRRTWPRAELPGYWYYEGKVYQVRGSLTVQEQRVLVQHYAESAAANLRQMAQEAAELRRRRDRSG